MAEKKHIPQGYKDSSLGIIPEGWSVKSLGDIGRITSGATPLRSNSKYHSQGNVFWVKTTDLNNGIILQTEEKITQKAINETSLKILPKGTVLVAMYGGFNQIGRTGLLGTESTINQALSAIIIENDVVDNFYLLAWLNLNVGLWKRFAGSSRKDPNITSKDVYNFPIILPSLLEQQKISRILSCWDEAIEKQTRLIEKIETRKRGIMQQLLTGEGKGWEDVKMGDLFERVTRRNSEGNTNVVTISAQRGFIKQTEFFSKSIASEQTDNYSLVWEGEFCYNKSYSNGYPWGAIKRLNEFEKAVVTTLYICFKIKDNSKASGDFFEHFFEAKKLNKGLTQIAHEGGRAHGLLNVTPSDFFSLRIIIPDLSEQERIANILKSLDKEINLLRIRGERINEQKLGLMQQLLTGKKRVKTIN